MQLRWVKNQTMPLSTKVPPKQTDRIFHLEPLSLQVATNAEHRNNRSRTHDSRKIKFVPERTTRPGKISQNYEPRVQHSVVFDDLITHGPPLQTNAEAQVPAHEIHEYAPTNSILGAANDETRGNSDGCIFSAQLGAESYGTVFSTSVTGDESQITDSFNMLFQNDLNVDFLDFGTWSPSVSTHMEQLNNMFELENNCITSNLFPALESEDVTREHNSQTISIDTQQDFFANLNTPVLHNSLVGKFQMLLEMCKISSASTVIHR